MTSNDNKSNFIQIQDTNLETKYKLSTEKETIENSSLRKLYTVSFVCLGFMIIEVIGGYIANSLAIMSDAAHLFSDLLGFIISIVSIYIAQQQANHQMSYGYHRAEVIGALVSVTIIWGLTVWLIWEASLRILYPSPVHGGIMFIVAVLGLIFNVVMGVILAYEGIDHGMHNHSHGDDNHDHSHGDHGHSHNSNKSVSKNNDNHDHEHDHEHSHENNIKDEAKTSLLKDYNESKEHNHSHDGHGHSHDSHDHEDHSKTQIKKEQNVNIRAALIHVIGDAIQNIGVIISGIIIYYNPELVIVDALCTFFFAIIVFFTTIRILKDCVAVIMEGCPIDNVDELKERLGTIEGVTEVHDLHVWSLSMGKVSMTCHLKSNTPQKTLIKAKELMEKKYGITHITIQVEDDDHPDECTQTLH